MHISGLISYLIKNWICIFVKTITSVYEKKYHSISKSLKLKAQVNQVNKIIFMNRFYLVVLLLAFISSGLENVIFGQGNIGSLKKLIQETENDSIKALSYNQITWSYFNVNVDSSLYFAEKALELSTEINNQVFIASALKALGRCYVMKNQYSTGIHYFNLALEIDEKRGDNVAKSATLMSMGNVYRRMNKHEVALDLDTISLRITKIYAENWLKQSGKEDQYAVFNTLFLFNNIGLDYLNLGDLETAHTYFEKFKNYLELKSLWQYEYLYYKNMGRLYFESGKDYPKALEYNLVALQSESQKNNYLYLGQISNSLGKIYLEMGELKQSKKYLDLAIAYSDSAKTSEFLKITYSHLSDYHSKIGKFEQALSFKNRYVEITDSVFNKENNELIADYEVMYETMKKEKKIEILQKEKEIQRLVNINQTIVIVVISVLIILLVIYLVIRAKRFKAERMRMKDEILEKDKELASFALFLAKKNNSIEKISSNLQKRKDDLKSEGKNIIEDVVKDLNQDIVQDSWKEFENKFTMVHPGFYENIINRFSNLNQNDLKMCSLLRLNLSSKEIASIIHISPPSVDVSRSRLRKKLNLSPNENLVEYLFTF